jgi:hypothetical protein
MKYPTIVVLALLFCGCTAVNVRPVTAEYQIKEVLIRENPKISIHDFLDVLIDGFERHGIVAKIVSDSTDPKDAYIVTYVAYRKWDMAPYLARATINILKDGRRIAQAEYHLRGGGGFSLMKWQGTKTKMDPVIDELLKGISPKG